MIGLNRKSGIALTARGRILVNATNLDGTLAKQISDQSENSSLPYVINSNEDMRVIANGWSEIGLTYGTEVWNKNSHFVKIGITAKYLAGVANLHLNVDKLKGTIDEGTNDVFLQNATGNLILGTGGASLENFQISDLTSFKSTGFGADLGVIYEWRPSYKTGEITKGNKYKLRVGASLTDIGSIEYKKDMDRSGGYKIHINDPNKLSLQELGDQSLDDIKTYLDGKPTFFTELTTTGSSYNVKLPTMLNLDVDYKLMARLYINAAANINFNQNDGKIFNSNYYNSFTATARIETKRLGVFLPINYSELTDLNAGVAFKLGPLFIGSGSVLTALLSSSKQADLFFGVRFGGLAK